MDLTYFDPVRSKTIAADQPESLARQLAEQLPARTTIRFLARPFEMSLEGLKSLQVHFEREKLQERHEFSCFVDPQLLAEQQLHLLHAMNFSNLLCQIDLAAPDFEGLDRLLKLCQEVRIKVTLLFQKPEAEMAPQTLQDVYFFLKNRLGSFELEYPEGFFPSVRQDQSFRKLAQTAQEVHLGQRFDAFLNEKFYVGLYEYMRLKLSPRVNTVLEINPFAQLKYFREFSRVQLPWQVTLSDLPNHQLNKSHLKSLDKTFDAIVLFQALPRFQDPQKALLMLQNYARPTTEWIVVQYNFASLPTLAQLATHQFQNALPFSAFWPYLRPQGKKSLENLFQFSGLNFEWLPTQTAIDEMKALIQQLDQALRPEFPDQWEPFLNAGNTMFWSGYGSLAMDMSQEQGFTDGFVDGFADQGFVSEGFL